MLNTAKFFRRFLPSFVLVSLIATVLHEYFHLITLRALGGEGIVTFGLGFLIFPWDESHVFPSTMPAGLVEQLLFSGVPSAVTVAILYFFYRNVSASELEWALWLAMWPQIIWTIAEPALWYAKITAPTVVASHWVPPSISYHTLLFLSWGLGALTLRLQDGSRLANRLSRYLSYRVDGS
jgi:hypothetical protein